MQKHLIMIQNLVDTIENDVVYDVNIIHLSEMFEISPWHFQRLFKSVVGDSLGSYVRGRRLTLGAKMLLESSQSIITIAFVIGFTSHESFTRSFKTYFGYTPKQFRKQRPKVLLNIKPLLTEALLTHITKGMILEPKIVEREEEILVCSPTQIPSPFITTKLTCEFVQNTWMTLFSKEGDISARVKERYYGITVSGKGDFKEELLDYFAAVKVDCLECIPNGMISYILPKQKVAIFSIITDLESDLVKRTIDYIYGYWLPNSNYDRGLGDDYELFDEVKDFMTQEFKSYYVIPVIDKVSPL